MSTIQLTVHRGLAQTCAFTHRLAERRAMPIALSPIVRVLDFVARALFYAWRNRRYLTFLKLANMALVNIQFFLKTERVIGRPYKMKIESTNICNTKCQLCPTGVGMEGRDKGKMDTAKFKRLVDRFRWHLFVLDLSMWGDPLIVPHINEMVRYAHDKGIWTYLSSNLHAYKIGRGQGEALIKSGLDMLTCSLHGASQETFAIYQPGKSFADTVAKVREIVAERERLKSPTPVIQLNFVVTRHNEHEKAQFQRLADELGCKAVFSSPSLNTRFLGQDKQLQPLGLAPDVLQKKVRAHLDEWLPRNRAYVLKPYEHLRAGEVDPDAYNGKKEFDCSWPWRSSVINWDGTAVTCCGSWDPKEDLGNVFDEPFGEVWNGRRYRMARRSFKRKVEGADKENNPCATCPGFML